jgi:hypothetical protein
VKICEDIKWLDEVEMEELHAMTMVKVAWLPTLVDKHCSSYGR